MGVRSLEMADALQHYLNGQDKESNRDDIFRAEAELDMTVKEISAMVTDLLGEPLAESEIREVKTQLRVSDEYESVSDYLAQILKLYLRIESAGVIFTQSQIDELQKLHNMVRDFIQDISQLEEWEDAIAYLPTMESKGRSITVFVRQLRDAHWARLSGEKLNPLVSTVYGDILSAYRKAKNHLMNVVQSRARVK